MIFKDEFHIAQSSETCRSIWKFLFFDSVWLFNELSAKEHHIINDVVRKWVEFPNIIPHEKYPQITRLVYDILFEEDDFGEDYKSLIKFQLSVLFLKLSKITLDSTVHEQEKDVYNKLACAIDYISSNYMYDISVSYLADICHLSETHFRRIFKLNFMVSPSEYIFNVRIKMASVLLKYTDNSVFDISEQVGFDSPSSFYRHFKKITGFNPRDWRKKCRSK